MRVGGREMESRNTVNATRSKIWSTLPPSVGGEMHPWRRSRAEGRYRVPFAERRTCSGRPEKNGGKETKPQAEAHRCLPRCNPQQECNTTSALSDDLKCEAGDGLAALFLVLAAGRPSQLPNRTIFRPNDGCQGALPCAGSDLEAPRAAHHSAAPAATRNRFNPLAAASRPCAAGAPGTGSHAADPVLQLMSCPKMRGRGT